MNFEMDALIMNIHEYDPRNDKSLSKDEYLSLSILQYLCYDLECDKDGGYAHYYGLDIQDVKPKVLEMLKFCNCKNVEYFNILLNAFDDDFSSNDWEDFYRTVDEMFTIWYTKTHQK